MKNTLNLSNKRKRVSTSLLLLLFFGLISSVNAQDITSVQDGPWNEPNTWGGSLPALNDHVLISDNHTVTLVGDFDTQLGTIEIGDNAVLDLQEFQIANVDNFTQSIGTSGILRTKQHFVEAVNNNSFYENSASIVEIYGREIDNYSISRSPFPNLRIVLSQQDDLFDGELVVKLATNMTIEGNLDVIVNADQVGGVCILQIGDETVNENHTITINGNISISSGAELIVERSAQNNTHTLNTYGNIINSGYLGLSNKIAANYTSDPVNGAVNLHMAGSEDVDFTVAGATRLSRLIINKDIDTKVTLSTDNPNNFKLFGRNDQDNTSEKALYIQQGILELGDNIQLPSLTTASGVIDNYTIGNNSKLTLNGNNCTVDYTQDVDGGFTLTLNGELEVLNGSFNAGRVSALLDGGKITATNNTSTINLYDIAYDADNLSEITVQGGILNVGNQIKRALANTDGVVSLILTDGGVININGENPDADFGMLEVFGAGSSFVFDSGAGILFKNGRGDNAVADLYLDPENYQFDFDELSTGVAITAESPNVEFSVFSTIDIPNFYTLSNIDLANNQAGANPNASVTVYLKNELSVSRNFLIYNAGAGATFESGNSDIHFGGVYINQGGTLAIPDNHTVYFDNFSESTVTTIATFGQDDRINSRFYNVVVNRDLGAEPVKLLSGMTIDGDLTFNYGGITSEAGQSVVLKGNIIGEASFFAQTIVHFQGETGQQSVEKGTLPNVEIDNINGVVTGGNVAINGNLTFTNGSLDIGSYLLTLGESSTVIDNIGNSRIRTSGLEGMRGVRKLFSQGEDVDINFTFPLLSGGNESSATINIANADFDPTLEGNTHITVKPISGVTPLTTDDLSDTELIIYWDIKQRGFELDPFDPINPASVSHSFAYSPIHELGEGLAAYIPGVFTANSWFTPVNGDPDEFNYVDEGNNTISFNAYKTDPEIANRFENPQQADIPEPTISGVFTAGLRGEFGTVRRFISRQNGGWSSAGTWDIDINGDDNGDEINLEGEVPTNGDVVRIELHEVTATSNDLRSYSLQVEGSLILGADEGADDGDEDTGLGLTGSRFNNITGFGTIITYPADDNGTFKYDFNLDFNDIDLYFGTVKFAGIQNAELPNNLTKINSLEVSGGGAKTLTTNLEVVESLSLTDGNLISAQGAKLTISDATNIDEDISLADLANMIPGEPIVSDSYVVGPMIIKGISPAATIQFPIGSSQGNYRPLGLDFAVNGGGEYILQAELIEGDANYEGIVYPGNLEAVSSLRYWKVTAISPQSLDFQNIIAFMSYDAAADGIRNIAQITNEVKLTKAPQLGQPYINPLDLNLSGNILANVNNTFNGFSILVFGTTDFESNPLPVTLVSFEGKVQGDGVALNWVTASEVNNSHFEVERSVDGENFDQIGTVKGFGTTTVTQNYSFIDAKPASGVVYYRLRQVDFDGAFEYSKIITVLVNKRKGSLADKFIVYPNPMQSYTFNIAEVGSSNAYATYNVTLQDVSGKVYYSKENTLNSAGSELASMVNKLGSGVYLLRISSGDNQQVLRLLK